MGSKPNIIEPLAPLLTKQQVAAFLNVRPRTVDRFRRDDKCFPQPRWLSDGTPRWLPHELHNWVNSRHSRRCRARVAAAPSTTTAPTTA
jgi:predicted DNA-binding transcriptional regulator AlpA